ncbi:13268_t:CDS:1, partial [Ambispora gerdemannii]
KFTGMRWFRRLYWAISSEILTIKGVISIIYHNHDFEQKDNALVVK